jgi:hypothetical protein
VKKFAVFIATTGGPIQIERLTPERAPQSMICISRSSNILPISGEYDDFVRRGSGIIEREFGPFEYESFRADISGSVGTGQSWQLPFFIAHAIDADLGSELVEDVDAADYVVWATGRVDYDLNILDVDHIAEKIKGSHSLFEKIASSQSKSVIAAPASQVSLLDEIPDFGENFSVLPLESGFQVCKDLDLNLEPKTASGSIKNRSGGKSRFAAAVLAAAIVIAWGFFYFAPVKTDVLVSWRDRVLPVMGLEQKNEKSGNPEMISAAKKPEAPKDRQGLSKGEQQVSQTKPRPIGPEIQLTAFKHPAGGSCLEVNFDAVSPVKHILPWKPGRSLSTELLDDVCRFSFSIDVGKKGKYVAIWIDDKSRRFVAKTLSPGTFTGLKIAAGRPSWSFELRRKKDISSNHHEDRLAVLIGDQPVPKELEWLRKHEDWSRAAAELAKKNVRLLTIEHRENP